MSKKRHSAEQIIHKLRQAEVHRHAVGDVCKQLEITAQTYYRWRKEYGGLRIDQARRLKDLERENGRLKVLVAELALDAALLREGQGSDR